MRDERRKAIQRNRKIVEDIKIDGHCADCEQWFPACAMDFDHVRGTKVAAITRLVQNGVRIERLLIEIDKCDLVCACCHRIRTAKRRVGRG